ncbi:CapA family protein [Halostella sp. PRR32]|uniref:CapA family protein n=1 Tax=Halostella sp. PRR32 TaxID=3098147 RepID=UPI002B1D321C|nr:CapA family protein [Halostella sp. PRR32]
MTRYRRLGLTGDVMLGRKVNERQRRRDATAVWGDTLEQLRSFDALCINLECCLSGRGTRWTRTRRPFHFRADPDWAVRALEAAGVDYACLANNHVLDFEEPALRDTLDALDAAGIRHSGAGRTRSGALDPATVSLGELTVAVVAFTDNTPEYAADEDSPGTARVEIDVDDERTRRLVTESLDRARAADPDLIVASLHWGPNMVEGPPEPFREFGRWLVNRGVDLIHGHSAHVFHGVELYDGAPIIYDAGDFVDDYAVDRTLRNDRSFLFEVLVDSPEGNPRELRLEPIEIENCTVNRADDETADWSRERMRDLSAPFGTTFDRDGDALVTAVDGDASGEPSDGT